ncbi:hypothetical protein GBA65_19195 [Rubrobacter marinus]|uniref:DUF4926 domain-containing protein n=1 Tax=Rubrobacter marinus TaxID=2653852 RepID=A0A6G8Q1F0_9ACTN|nr:hypothetical protein [Rubrobacter marinus]QIN80293.1 hypothetical protein GBA65_19195 [Rubrobacter marinus]
MEDTARTHEGWVGYKEYDLVSIPADIPAIGVKIGETGLVRDLDLRLGGDVIATLQLISPTGQTKGWVEMEVRPSERVLSYSAAG